MKRHTNGNGRPLVKDILARYSDSVIKLDLGGGPHPQPGCINLDVRDLPTVDIVHDWEEYPWPLPDASVTLIIAGHVVEHVNPNKFGFIRWMDECWRVLKTGGQIMISTPFAGSAGYFSDPTHVNPCTNRTWEFFDPLKPSRLFFQYCPKPWEIKNLYWQVDGNMEVLLAKRRMDPSYQLTQRIGASHFG